jgi:small subunit ribosomal protein S7
MRRRRAEKRGQIADPKYNDKIISKFINMVMGKGKKSIAQKIVYTAIETAAEKINKDPKEVFYKAVDNVRPLVEVKPRRVGGATYQVPVEVKTDRGQTMALRWIRNFSRAKKGKPMHDRLAEEILSAYKGEGPSVKKKEDTHKMAEANKAFSHYRW